MSLVRSESHVHPLRNLEPVQRLCSLCGGGGAVLDAATHIVAGQTAACAVETARQAAA